MWQIESTMLPSLDPETRAALREAADRPWSYRLRFLLDPGERRLLVVLGEAHVKMRPAHELGRRIVSSFSLRGVESFPATVFAGRLLRYVIHTPRWLLMKLSFGRIRGSTITTALDLDEGVTFRLERADDVPPMLHVAAVYLLVLHAALALGIAITSTWPWLSGLWLPVSLVQAHFTLTIVPAVLLRRRHWSGWINPAVAILGLRDATMARGTREMMERHPEATTAVVVMGRAHLDGYGQNLIEAGYREVDSALLL